MKSSRMQKQPTPFPQESLCTADQVRHTSKDNCTVIGSISQRMIQSQALRSDERLKCECLPYSLQGLTGLDVKYVLWIWQVAPHG